MTPIEWIFEAGCLATGATLEQIRGRGRYRWIVLRRKFIARKMREAGHSYPKIGKALGRHHTTIMFFCGWRRNAA